MLHEQAVQLIAQGRHVMNDQYIPRDALGAYVTMDTSDMRQLYAEYTQAAVRARNECRARRRIVLAFRKHIDSTGSPDETRTPPSRTARPTRTRHAGVLSQLLPAPSATTTIICSWISAHAS